MASRRAIEYLNGLIQNNHPLLQDLRLLKDWHDKKLWHQLTTKLEKFVENDYFNTHVDELANLYENFVRDFEAKINQLALIRIVLSIVRRMPDKQHASQFLETILQKPYVQIEKEAFCLGTTHLALLKMDKDEEAKKLIEKVGEILDTLTGADPAVYSAYYYFYSLYYRKHALPSEFYHNSLMYLVYSPYEKLPVSDQVALATDLGISALISKDIYNFGELLGHPILKSLEGTPNVWLVQMLYAFNAGNIAEFSNIWSQKRQEIQAQPILSQNQAHLLQKISLLALMELFFVLPSENRTLGFNDISGKLQVPRDSVEMLVMKAMSLKLIKGNIDEVNEKVNVNWVQPRILSLDQIQQMRNRLERWNTNVKETLYFMEEQANPNEVFT